jgi:predicted RNA-binding protein YlqC (UPF0109 family)
MRRFVEALAQALVDSPHEVVVEGVTLADALILRLQVAPSDHERIVGRQGQTLRALRILLSAASLKLHQPCSLELLDASDTVLSNRPKT